MTFTTLVTTDELAAHLDDPLWVVLDCRFMLTDTEAGQRAYHQGHIPGARYAHLDKDLSVPVTKDSGRHPLPDPEVLAKKLGEWGVGNDTQVIAYDDSFGAMAGRLWWLLRWLGHVRVALLDSGLPKWQREQLPLTAEVPEIKPVTFSATPRHDLWVETAVVEEALRHGDTILIDARAEERFSGEIEPLDPVAGHIPGAVNYPYEDNLDFSGEFLNKNDLRGEYEGLLAGKSPDRVIHMCGSGVTACHNILAMEHAGLHGARLYAGSWSEWIRDRSRPIATGN